MANGVDPEPALLRGVFEWQAQGMRRVKCGELLPAVAAGAGGPGAGSVSPHTDPNGLTLLLQMNRGDVQGLQASKDDRWLSVRALDSAFVPDALEVPG